MFLSRGASIRRIVAGAWNGDIVRTVRLAVWIVVVVCSVAVLPPRYCFAVESNSTLANTIVFTPSSVALKNPATSKGSGTAGKFTLGFTVYDQNGNVIPPSASQPVVVSLYGAPSGVIAPASAQVTTGSGITFSYNGKYLPNPVTVEAYMQLTGSSYSIGVTQILLQKQVTAYGAESYDFSYWCDTTSDPGCTDKIIESSLRFQAAVGYDDATQSDLQPFGLDTGSLGVIVPLSSLGPDAIGPAGAGIKFYNSSGNTYQGNYYLAPITILATRNGSTTMLKTFPIKVLAIDKAYCAKGYTQCEQNPPTPDLRYIGVGFDRNSTTDGDYFDSPADNPFLQIQGASTGTAVNPGYILTSVGGRLGLVKQDTKGFKIAQLTQNTSVPGDWNAAPGCFGFPDLKTSPKQFCGSLLMDVGIDHMYLDLSPKNRPVSVVEPGLNGTGMPDGTVMSILAGTPKKQALRYSFTYSSSTNPVGMAPASVKWIDPNSSEVFVNTGRNVLKGSKYLYDARHGEVGFKPLGAVSIPVVTTEFKGVEQNKYHVYVSNGGGKAHPMVVDTGSQLMVVPSMYVGGQAQPVTPTQCHEISYGDGTTWCGRFYEGPVSIGVPSNYKPGTGTYPTTRESFRFLVADPNDTECISQYGNCKMPSDLTNRGIMGIGFGQGSYGADYNALLQLKGMVNGDMRPGYILRLGKTKPTITAGLTPDNTEGFGLIQLAESQLHPGQWDPDSFKGCMTLSNGDGSTVFNQCANILFDTGTVNFTLKTPAADEPLAVITQNPPYVDPGTKVSISAPETNPVVMYDYSATSPTTWANQQSSVSWLDREAGAFFLIGQYLFMQYDYLFDPAAGWIGFRPEGAVSSSQASVRSVADTAGAKP
jgi:hypothetical protein